jgi:YD repeat-containing protein
VDPSETNQETMAIEQDDILGTDILEEVTSDTIVALDYGAGSIGVDLKGSYEVAQVYLRPGIVTRVTAEQLRIFVSDTNNTGSDAWSEVAEFGVREAEDGGFDIILKTPALARYVKVKTDYNERDLDFEPIDFAEFKGVARDIIKVYYYVTQRVEDYEYDNAGNRTSETISYDGNITEQNRDYIYYPGTNRLLTDGRYVFQYDSNGNMLAKGKTILIAGVEIDIKDVTDWSSFESSIPGEAESINFAATGEQTQYSYDLLNRLVSVTKNTETVANYTYNAEGLRIKKEKNSEAEYYFFDLGGEPSL